MDYFKSLFSSLLSQDTELAYCRGISKHLANVYLYDLRGVKALHPNIREKAVKLVAEMKRSARPIAIVSTIRTAAIQDGYYKQGRETTGSIITNAQGLESYHNYGLAFDVAFDGTTPTDNDWEALGEIGESLGLEWGGRWESFPDRPHFQWTDNGRITWKKLKDYFNTGKI